MAASPNRAIISGINQALKQHADPKHAAQQQAYMKSSMPHAGLTASLLRTRVKDILQENPVTDKPEWLATANQLWNKAKVREHRYAALEIMGLSRYQKRWLAPDCLPDLRHFIETGAWWDFLDNLAANHIGLLLREHTHEIEPILRTWIDDEDLWIRRSAILAQLKFREATNLQFLHEAIQGSITDSDFFARKAIGWALRAYSRTDSDWVIDYVTRYADALSPLLRREACKLLLKSGTLQEVPGS